MDSHITSQELLALQLSALPRDAPYAISGVSSGFFSVARYSGGAVVNGQRYVYVEPTDELIRADVVKWLAKMRKAVNARPGALAPKAAPADLFEG